MRSRGFTLIELIVVIAIIAILAAIIAPNAFKAVEKAKISGTSGDWKSIKTAAMAFYSDTGTWPGNCSGATCVSGDFFNNTGGNNGWDGPYLDKWPTGRWGNGVVSWNFTIGAGSSNFGASNAPERWVTITNVPATSADKLDKAIDSGTTSNYTSGNGRYTGTTMTILVTRDGPTN